MSDDKVGFLKIRGRVFINAGDYSKYLWKRAANAEGPATKTTLMNLAEEVDLNIESAMREM